MRKSFIDRLLLPFIVGLTTVVAALILWQRMLTNQSVQIRSATQEQLLFVKDKLEGALKVRILDLDRLAGSWNAHDQQSDVDMESEAAPLLDGTFQTIEWVDPTFHVRWVAPQGANEPGLGPDLGADAHQRVALQTAGDSGRTEIMPVTSQTRGRGLLVCVPLFKDQKLRGFLTGVIRYQDLFSSTLQEVERNYWVAIYDGDEEIYSRAGSSSRRAQAWGQQTDIRVRQMTWRVRVWPNPQTLAHVQSPLPSVTFLAGILIAALLGFAVYLGETAQFHSQEVVATNKALLKEIAGREQAEEALRQAQKMEAVGRLAGGVAHDFNNLLMVIRGHAALSLNHFGPKDPIREELREILEAADRASSLTRQLLALGRKQVLQPKVLDLNSLATQAAELLSPALGPNMDLHLDLDSNLGRAKADAAQVEQAIMNLAFNARDAMPDGGTLTIRTANTELDESWTRRYPEIRPGPHVILEVRDNGCGMDEETQSHLFEPFFSTKERSKGTGLGLATVYGTVNQSGGCIAVSSKTGEGTTIRIYLPSVEEPIEDAEEPTTLSESMHGHETVLLVEDDDAVRRMTCEFLKIKGYSVLEARSPVDAIQVMESHNGSIGLVLTDVVMPRMKGTELADRLVKLYPGLKVLYMSAYTEDAAIASGFLGPGCAFIEKPFSPEELAGKVRKVLGLGTTMDHNDAAYKAHG
jgi:signal transduction histidine kinase/ActR/RegA family two-component response regulator